MRSSYKARKIENGGNRMTDVEAIKILAVLKAAYLASYNRLPDDDAEAIVNLWAEMFIDEPYEVVGAAVKSFIAADISGYPPSIGQIKDSIRKIMHPADLSEAEAVAKIMQATRNSTYNAREEFEKLPPMLQKLVGSPAQLREWAMADGHAVNTVIASNLQRSYRAVQERQREYDALPENIKACIGLTAPGIKLID